MELLLTTGPTRWDNSDRDGSTFLAGRLDGNLGGINDFN